MSLRGTPLILPVICLFMLGQSATSSAVDYSIDIQPIFQSRCYTCHGTVAQKSGLRLDKRTAAMAGGESGAVILPGDAERSPLIHHIERRESVAPMPPKGDPLTREQIALIREWIDSGANWPEQPGESEGDPRLKHWSWQPLERPAVPSPKDSSWVRNPIDAFVLDRLEGVNLAPSPEADRRTLIRRLSFDLIGLPPSPEQVEQFVNDASPDAYERLVDRLLGSPHYGERWARHWLDVAHYGESHGFDKDKRRLNAWPYRDYVIESFNADKPWPMFIKEQIAGDYLYPDKSQAIIATGFLAAGPWDFVGHVELREGTMEKERVRVLDRDDFVANTITSFMSLTVQCSRCHDHKFDPISQREYYQLQAVFAGINRDDRPYDATSRETKLTELKARMNEATSRRDSIEGQWKSAWPNDVKMLAHVVAELRAQQNAQTENHNGEQSPTNGYHSAIETDQNSEKWVILDIGSAQSLTRIILYPAMPTDFAPDTPGFGFPLRYRIETAIQADFSDAASVADFTNADAPNPGDSPLTFEFEERMARYVRVTATKLWPRTNDFVFALAELRVFAGNRIVSHNSRIEALDSIESGRWSRAALVDAHTSRAAISDITELNLAHLESSLRQREAELKTKTEAMLSPELRLRLDTANEQIATIESQINSLPQPQSVYAVKSIEPREIRLLHRGEVQSPVDEPLKPGALSLVSTLEPDLARETLHSEGESRARLADWIADPRNPLTWRSITNRVWGWHFGASLVDTPNDFGIHGSLPSHPELLDWLASEFRDSGGALKSLHKMIVMSATYRQSSFSRPLADEIDAQNRLLWRMNRTRLDADALRDSILSVGGTLNTQLGGSSFDLFGFKDDHSPHYDYENFDAGPQEWRRSVYRTIIRSVPDPFMYSMDCADPNINMSQRGETYTALQALSLMNDSFVLKHSRYLADRIEKLTNDETERTNTLFMLALGRNATDDERGMFAEYAAKHGWPAACRIMLNTSEFLMVD